MTKYKKIILSVLVGVLLISLVFILFNKDSSSIDSSILSTGDSQTIAILDSGLDGTLLTEYEDNIISKYNVFDDSENVDDEIGHGTALVTFLLGSDKYNLPGILPSAKIMIIKIIDNEGNTTFEYLEKGILYAKQKKRKYYKYEFRWRYRITSNK